MMWVSLCVSEHQVCIHMLRAKYFIFSVLVVDWLLDMLPHFVVFLVIAISQDHKARPNWWEAKDWRCWGLCYVGCYGHFFVSFCGLNLLLFCLSFSNLILHFQEPKRVGCVLAVSRSLGHRLLKQYVVVDSEIQVCLFWCHLLLDIRMHSSKSVSAICIGTLF